MVLRISRLLQEFTRTLVSVNVIDCFKDLLLTAGVQ
jgi:hypothetical protein